MEHRNPTQKRSTTLFLLWTLCLSILWGSPLAMAQDTRDEARTQFQLGNEAFGTGDYAAALEHFQEANRLSPHDRLLLYIGQSFAGLEDFEQAIEYVEQYAATSPEAAGEVEPILDEYRRAMTTAFDRAITIVHLAAGLGPDECADPDDPRCGLEPPGTTPIFVYSSPAGADVYIDDLSLGSVGVTPLETRVFRGNHTITVALDYHESVREDMAAGEWHTGDIVPVVDVVLTRREANVDITFDPVTARVTYVTEDGEVFDLGTGGFEGVLPAGEGRFIMQRGGEERTIEHPLAGEQSVESFTLNLNAVIVRGPVEQGTLVVRSDLPFAEISVDGALLGEGIGEFEINLNPGSHTIRVSQEGYHTVVDTVGIGEAESMTWRAPTRLEEISTVPWAGIVVTTVGVGATTAGLIMFLNAQGTAGDLDDCESDPACTVDPDEGEQNDTDTLISAITLGVGGATLIAGVVMLLTQGPDQTATVAQDGLLEDLNLRAGPVPDGFGLTFDFRF